MNEKQENLFEFHIQLYLLKKINFYFSILFKFLQISKLIYN